MEGRRTRLQKGVLIVLAALAVVFCVLMLCSRLHPGVVFDGTLLRLQEADGGTTYTGKLHGEQVSVSVVRESGAVTTVTCTVEDQTPDVYRMEYPLDPILAADGPAEGQMVDGIRITKNGKTLFEGGFDRDTASSGFGWYDAGGRWDSGVAVSSNVGGGQAGQTLSLTLDERNVMYFARGPELTARGSWVLYGMMVFLSILAALDTAFPLTLFRLRHCCDVRNPEPTDLYLAMQRLRWVLYPVLLLFGYLFALRVLP